MIKRMKTIAIVGYGRFGKLLAELSRGYFSVYVIEADATLRAQAASDGHQTLELTEVGVADYVFLAVPISSLEAVLKSIDPYLQARHVIIDVASVKVYPVNLMKKYVRSAHILAMHPMFGPDSASKGLKGLQVAYCPVRVETDDVEVVLGMWHRHEIVTIETTPEAHDNDTAYSQAFTYTIAKLILATDIPQPTFTTRSFNAITEVARLSARDTEQLFHDMLLYNPYFPDMKRKLEHAIVSTGSLLDEIADEQQRSGMFGSFK